MEFYKVLTCLCLQQVLTKTGARMAAKNIFSWSLPVTNKEFNEHTARYGLVNGLVLEQSANGFYLHSADRTSFICDEFLEKCAPDHREDILRVMGEMEVCNENPQGDGQ